MKIEINKVPAPNTGSASSLLDLHISRSGGAAGAASVEKSMKIETIKKVFWIMATVLLVIIVTPFVLVIINAFCIGFFGVTAGLGRQ